MNEEKGLNEVKNQKNPRAYYGESIQTFLSQSSEEVLGIIHRNSPLTEITLLQRNTWITEIDLLKS